jgi:hypothetical protein
MRFQDADGNNFIGTCYQGYGRICCFYDRSDYDVCSVVVWAEMDVNRKQEGLLTGNNRQRAKKIDESIIPKKQQIKLTT